MDLKFVYQPEHHFRLFDLPGQSRQIAQSIDEYDQVPVVTIDEAVEALVIFVPQVQDMVKLVKEKCQQPKDNLSIDESASIMLYTMEWIPQETAFYYILNRQLDADDHSNIKSWYHYLKLFSLSLSKLPTSSSRIFYRGIKFDIKMEYSLREIFFWYGFSLCTSSLEILDKEEFCFAQTDIRTVFAIRSTQGKNISQHSFYKTKNEILLPCGLQFQVVSTRISKDNLRLIILKEIPVNDTIESTVISLDDNNPTDKSFDLLFQKRTKKYKNFSEINLRNQNLMDHHMKSIVTQAIQKKQCTWLSLQNNQITSTGLCIIADGLKTDESLESLYLSQNAITDTGVIYLTKILSDNNYLNLTILSLDYNCIRDEGVQCLADMLERNEILTDLWISYNNIGDQGVQALADVLTSKNKTLMQLYLHGNKLIKGSNIDCLLHMLKVNTTLNTLWLQDCSLSEENKEKLNKSVHHRENFDLYV